VRRTRAAAKKEAEGTPKQTRKTRSRELSNDDSEDFVNVGPKGVKPQEETNNNAIVKNGKPAAKVPV